MTKGVADALVVKLRIGGSRQTIFSMIPTTGPESSNERSFDL